MLKIYLQNGALVFDTAGKKQVSIVSKPNIIAFGDDVKIDFKMSGILFEQTKHYTDIEVAGTVHTGAVETVGAIGELCAGFKKGGVVTPSTPPTTGEWQPHPDWWDIERIFNDDPDPNKRFIVLLSDSMNTFVFNNTKFGNVSAYYRTSDGSFYAASSGSFTHTFDTTKDKPCADGYKTRWVMVYSSDRFVVCNLSNTDNNYSIYIYAGGNSESSITAIKTISVGDTSTANRLLEAFVLGNYSQLEPNAIGNSAFYNCSSLYRVDVLGSNNIGNSAFQNCNSLATIKLGSGNTAIQNSAFINCVSLKSININGNSIATIGATNPFSGCLALLAFITPDNFTAPANLNLSSCIKFSESSAIELFNKLATATTARTITFGSTLLDRWSPTTKQIATNKGYTLA